MKEKSVNGKSKLGILARFALGIGGVALLIAWSGGSFEHKLGPADISIGSGVPVPRGAETLRVKTQLVAPRIDIVGTCVSESEIHLSSRLSAYVQDVYVSAGDPVKAGQLLIALDDRELLEQLAAGTARLNHARIEYRRTQRLMKTQATTDQALTAVRSDLNGAKAQVERIKVMLTFTKIRSPIDGRVTDRQVEVGDLANPGQVLLGVYDQNKMRIEVPVPLRLVEKLKLGDAVDVKLDRPLGVFHGEVTQIVGEVDPPSRTQLVKVHIDGVHGQVLPGTFGRVWVLDDKRPSILAPASAVYRVGQLELVQVVEGNRAVRRLVKTGASYGEDVEILSGLSDGDVILTKPIKG
ncbi:efflux RND transporter periplasmic adaptor subunit [bacterium]|nr:efflux RND transporter periplasmic adaptor subunit [bacterium]